MKRFFLLFCILTSLLTIGVFDLKAQDKMIGADLHLLFWDVGGDHSSNLFGFNLEGMYQISEGLYVGPAFSYSLSGDVGITEILGEVQKVIVEKDNYYAYLQAGGGLHTLTITIFGIELKEKNFEVDFGGGINFDMSSYKENLSLGGNVDFALVFGDEMAKQLSFRFGPQYRF